MKIGILFGGNSQEHEISIISAFQLKKRIENKYDVYMLYLDFNNNLYDASKVSLNNFKSNKIKGLKKTRFVNNGIKRKKLDCVILCNHGENGEDGIAAALCNFYRIPFVGSDLFASSCAIDKWKSYLYLSSNGINMINSQLYTYDDYLNNKELFEYPIIAKPIKGGSSIGIFVANNEEEFHVNIKKYISRETEYIIQKFYSGVEEYNLAITSKGFSSLEQIIKKDSYFSFDNKYNESFKQMHQKMHSDENKIDFEEIGRRVYDLLGCSGIIRIDFFKIDSDIYVNEINIIPGALAMYLFNDFDEVLNAEIEKSIHKNKVIYEKGMFLSKSDIQK